MTTLAEKMAAVLAAEQRCEDQRLAARQSLDTLKGELRRSATPGRIVVSGLALGFVSGLRAPGTGAAASLGGQLLGGPVLSMLMESVVPGLMAGLTAAATEAMAGDEDAAAAEEDAADAAADAADDAVEAVEEEGEDAAPEPQPRPRRRKTRHVDA